MHMRRCSPAARILVGLIVFVGCEGRSESADLTSREPPLTGTQRTALAEQLSIAEARWARRGTTEYRLVLDHWTVGHVSRAELRVVADSVVSFSGLPNDRGELPILPAALWPSIPELFEDARAAIRDAAWVAVEFNDDLGYPEYLQIDGRAGVLDDEVWYRVREVEPR